ncbi:hypothetical protein B9T25_00480 [Acinetobacter sp. ANC 4470]|uniref:hypothetical protein n=1 Tax=Acinetobacter sp. ANC 4470 TaxID=1977881 RepID=UPI000A353A46|nr:hypothetical protein [Acinetobacter sp. ANC 4470]OTG69119.1 hypothetical protein B9T25_00480 [Acinetobacter sp. ANC 4470]
MHSQHYLKFHPADNPMYLKKLGNWVITFINSQDEFTNIQLAITSVLPRQVSDNLQPTRIIIHQTEFDHRWLIQQIECYDSLDGKDKLLSCHDKIGKQMIQNIMQEFNKYDVEVSLL